jgi:hypothetical protein
MQSEHPAKAQTEPKTPDGSPSKARAPLFHARPLAVAAVGLLFGLLLGDGFSPTDARIATLALLAAGLGARLCKKAMWTVFLLCMAAGFLRIGIAAPNQLPSGKWRRRRPHRGNAGADRLRDLAGHAERRDAGRGPDRRAGEAVFFV